MALIVTLLLLLNCFLERLALKRSFPAMQKIQQKNIKLCSSKRFDNAMIDTYDKTAAEIKDLLKTHNRNQLLVGIAGPPGSGKSTISSKLLNLLEDATVVPMDGFHLSKAQLSALPNAEEAFRRRGSHWTFDGELFVRSLRALKERGEGVFPSFDHSVGDPIQADIQVTKETRIVLVEGNYLLLEQAPWDQIKALLDFVYFVEADINTLERRVIERHMKALGDTLEQAEERARGNDTLNAKLVLESRIRADRIIQSL